MSRRQDFRAVSAPRGAYGDAGVMMCRGCEWTRSPLVRRAQAHPVAKRVETQVS